MSQQNRSTENCRDVVGASDSSPRRVKYPSRKNQGSGIRSWGSVAYHYIDRLFLVRILLYCVRIRARTVCASTHCSLPIHWSSALGRGREKGQR